ncbi:HEPN domain-containing protein [Shewanella indica]|uniref:ApeA N-terminal domain 1-containing protein n=1 Tax=Shewanella indica TaxID=768528 RepID=UPI003D369E48
MKSTIKNVVKVSLNDSEFVGALELDGSNTSLTCWQLEGKRSNAYGIKPLEIKGFALDSFENITLLDVLNLGESTHSKKTDNGQLKSLVSHRFFPHYVVTGPTSFNHNDEIFDSIQFEINGLSNIFTNNKLLQYVNFADHLSIQQLISTDRKSRNEILNIVDSNDAKPIDLGENPLVFIHTGLNNICKLQTSHGLISLDYLTSGSQGLHNHSVDCRIACTIKFNSKKNFRIAYNNIWPVLNLFTLIAGHKLFADKIDLIVERSTGGSSNYNVYSSMYVQEDVETSYHQGLINPNRNLDEFSKLLPNWLDRTENWMHARNQFFNSFSSNMYSSDRLVTTANMFDIIPDEEYCNNNQLPDDLIAAREKCKNIFKSLNHSPERDSILGALGRIGKLTLKNKVKERAAVMSNITKLELEDFDFVINQCIDCRNYFVHGSVKRFDYFAQSDLVHFFIDTLEFIFGISELAEAGWDFNRWKNDYRGFHPYSSYLSSYIMNLNKLKTSVEQYKLK